jgi:hypothetical protein
MAQNAPDAEKGALESSQGTSTTISEEQQSEVLTDLQKSDEKKEKGAESNGILANYTSASPARAAPSEFS